MFNLVIDAGHGGKDPGACGNGLKEKDINLNVALLLKEKLDPYKKEINLKLTREDDTFLELSDRVKISNNFKADLFISIHCNSASNTTAKGVETYCYKLSNSKGANSIHQQLITSKAFTKDRKIKEASYYVLKNTQAHAVLCELAFISNKEDSIILRDCQNDLAESILRGVLNYFGINYQQQNSNTSQSDLEGQKIYRVCVGAFGVLDNAKRLRDELKLKGYEAYIVEK